METQDVSSETGTGPPPMTPIEGGEAFLARIAHSFAPPFVSKFGALTLDKLDEAGPEHVWLIDGWLSEGDKSVVGGPSQSGKSFLAIHAGMCVATDMEFFGAKVKPGLVIYQAGEGARGVKKRLRAWRKHFGVNFTAKTPFVLLQSSVDLYKADGDTPALIVEIKAIAAMYDVPLRLLVIDTLATAAIGADENAARDMGVVMSNVAKINAETKAHVCIVHHMNADATKLRGSTAIYANIDQTLYVKRNDSVRTVSLGKQRDDDASPSFQFELMSVELSRDPNDRPVTSCVCLPVGVKEAIRRSEEQKGYRLNDQQILFMRALFDADKKFGEPVPADMQNVPAAVRSLVAYDDVKRAFAALSPSDSLPAEGASAEDIAAAVDRHRETLKKRIQRTREFLTTANIIGFDSGKIWYTGRALRAFPNTLPKPEPEIPIPAAMVGVDPSSIVF